jgi:hypothetical protein
MREHKAMGASERQARSLLLMQAVIAIDED